MEKESLMGASLTERKPYRARLGMVENSSIPIVCEGLMKGENRRKSGISLCRVIYQYFFEHTVGVHFLIQSTFLVVLEGGRLKLINNLGK